MKKFTIAIHGGAGTISKKSMTPEKEAAYLQALNDGLTAGYDILEKNGDALEAVKAAVIELDNNVNPDDPDSSSAIPKAFGTEDKEKKFGTVGAVACDANGNLAAGTSTGGMTNKRFGRVGDSPIIGIGTYANNKTCAISCTGHGEPFIKAVAAYDVSCLMEYKGLSLEGAMSIVVMDKLLKMEGQGGMIGVYANGNASLIFNSEGMYRGFCSSDGIKEVSIYK